MPCTFMCDFVCSPDVSATCSSNNTRDHSQTAYPVADALQTLVKPTVAKAFLGSMQDLNAPLLRTTCNFIRCIKPNAAMQCGVYDNR